MPQKAASGKDGNLLADDGKPKETEVTMAYGDIYEMTKGFEFPLSARNECGENVVIDKGRNENGDYFCTHTMQKNGWVRMNFYYSNGDYEELYEL